MNSQDISEIWRKFHAWGSLYGLRSDSPPVVISLPLLGVR